MEHTAEGKYLVMKTPSVSYYINSLTLPDIYVIYFSFKRSRRLKKINLYKRNYYKKKKNNIEK